jgi:hypothetical protein
MPETALKPQVFERGDKLYIALPISPFNPAESEIKEFAFAQDLKKMAPNEYLMWLQGNYVEADNANHNGQMWTDGDLRIKSLTPMFMPVTVMHDPRTAVGLIADVSLKTPEADQVARSRIDTSLAIWAHRFPDVAEEVDINYRAGSLMQSMECHSPAYECAECGQVFHKLPEQAERRNWCEHMEKSDGSAPRRLMGVVFTGTGLIFGTRGAKGANPDANLDVFQDEVAEYHDKAHRDTGKPAPKREKKGLKNVETVEISKSEYDRLQALDGELKAERATREKAETERDEAVQATEKAETEKKTAETAKDEAETKIKDFEEKAQQSELAGERMSALGSAFKEKLGEFTAKRLSEQAKDLSDEEWDNRLKELEETTAVKRDAQKEGDDKDKGSGSSGEEFSREETAAAQAGGGGGNGSAPGVRERQSVVAGLVSRPAKKTDE